MEWAGKYYYICLVCFGEKEREGRVIKTVIHIGISRCFRLAIREHYSNGAQKIQTDGKCSGKRAFHTPTYLQKVSMYILDLCNVPVRCRALLRPHIHINFH
jgi:hypothetical protein